MMQHNEGVDEAVAFLAARSPSGPWHLCAIVPDGALTARTFFAEDIGEMRAFISSRNGRANLYVHVNPLKDGRQDVKATKDDVPFASWAHVDIDDLDALDRVTSFLPPPTVVVCSGGGYNLYWALVRQFDDVARVERINRWLVQQLDGDPAATDVSRILRLPGTLNLPTKVKRERGRTPSQAYLVKELTDWTRRYDLEDFGDSPTQLSISTPTTEADDVTVISDLPASLSDRLRKTILLGDDPERPRGSDNPRYKSRSEAVFAAACALVQAGMDEKTAAGVLINSTFGISASILERRSPAAEALRQIRRANMKVKSAWPDGNEKSGAPRRSFQNAQAALLRLGFEFSFDAFRRRMIVTGIPMQVYEGEVSDQVCLFLRDAVDKKFGFDPGNDLTRDAVSQLCIQNTVDPVCEYLASLAWDGVKRIDRWLIDYAGAEDNEYVTAVSAIMLIAAVRRPRRPGVKFDTIPVIEGPQGTGKSSILQLLAGDAFFSDQDILALDSRAQMEALEGVWVFEIGELAGLRHTDVNKVKAFASRQVDRARPAYARFIEARPRRGILVGTTNDDQYLKDETGNRRFWPVRTGRINLEGLREVRDQLWAEAAERERDGDSIQLPENLWAWAEAEQKQRLEQDEWESLLEDVRGESAFGKDIAASSWLMTDVLDINAAAAQPYQWKKLKRAMTANGWTGPETVTRRDGTKAKGYWRLSQRDNDEEPL